MLGLRFHEYIFDDVSCFRTRKQKKNAKQMVNQSCVKLVVFIFL